MNNINWIIRKKFGKILLEKDREIRKISKGTKYFTCSFIIYSDDYNRTKGTGYEYNFLYDVSHVYLSSTSNSSNYLVNPYYLTKLTGVRPKLRVQRCLAIVGVTRVKHLPFNEFVEMLFIDELNKHDDYINKYRINKSRVIQLVKSSDEKDKEIGFNLVKSISRKSKTKKNGKDGI